MVLQQDQGELVAQLRRWISNPLLKNTRVLELKKFFDPLSSTKILAMPLKRTNIFLQEKFKIPIFKNLSCAPELQHKFSI